ncbi:NAD(P)-dependent alcohol dehydrogenase [Paenarthrobacter ureafaciens]|uniref:NAD(P)-dependent alcohol dehydrogenase n=1 Tax=Paenarthrobacter ureafaciens TaxID=37931 RepID=UPI002DB75953|nr:NAD(P)-dependent alcohol dehydrogenase [Paenarthrobacter ureafaciens]MEC3853911.1 NAD(P)-dependent alcohol dehydrogenase [Paenarthrobacter ureafaciens]
MKITAAVVQEADADLVLRELELDEPRSDEIRVRLVATGVCHTDAAILHQLYPTRLPIVLGHEGAGVVEAVGQAVTGIRPGDHVILSVNSCGHCVKCLTGDSAYCEDLFARNFGAARADGTTSLTAGGEPVGSHFFGQSSFASHANVAARSVVVVDANLDELALLGPLGCGFQTGAGAVLNELRPAPGSTLAVFGTGAVGTAALMAARVAGCAKIIAVDVVPERLELARELGATDVINSRSEDPAERLHQITSGRGLDFALDTTGIPAVLRTAVEALAIRGTAALVGAAKPGTEASFEIGASLTRGWTFKTIVEGSAVPQVFIPALISLWRTGRFPFDKLVKTYPLAAINDAFADSANGTTVKPIVLFEQPDSH